MLHYDVVSVEFDLFQFLRDAKALQEKAAKKAGQGATGGDSAAGKGNNKK